MQSNIYFSSKIFRAKPGMVAPGCKNNAPEASLPLRLLHVIFNPCVYFFLFSSKVQNRAPTTKLRGQNQAEAQKVAADARRVAVTEGNTARLRWEAPAAAAVHPERAR